MCHSHQVLGERGEGAQLRARRVLDLVSVQVGKVVLAFYEM